jgi:3,4-dihydroxy 2-butanone 4-phosphate synthase/GTP cyclohydrolase II
LDDIIALLISAQDVKAGTSTGVSAKDRCLTVRALASSDSRPNHFRKPGHIFPLRYREGGVLKRAGHTEAAVDLAVMAGFAPAGVLCELINKDGSMSRLPELKEFAKAHNLPLISIADLIRHKQKSAKLVTRTAVARLPTKWGNFRAYSYRSEIDGIEHVAMVKVFIWTCAQRWEYHDLLMIAISWLHNLLAMLSKLVLHINPFLMSMSSES